MICVSLWTIPAGVSKTTEGVNWHAYEEGVKKAQDSDKPIVLHFYTDWCAWCKKMDRETFSNPRIQESMNLNFIPIKINAESKEMIKVKGKEVKTSTLARSLGVVGFPTTVFLESNGADIGSVPGYIDQDRMSKILVYVREKAYKKTSFEEFTRQRMEFRATGQ
jgi:thioredoxin-related protein